jgi:iron complex outermembrane recepter protein
MASVFQITRPAARADAITNIYGYTGEQRNRGLELSAYGEIQRGLRGIVSVAFIDPELTRTAGGTNQGNDAAGIPNRRLSAVLDWDTPWVQGLALNGRMIHTSGAYLTDVNDLRFDSWTRFDVGARYVVEMAGKPVVLRANIENLFDKAYWLTAGTYVTVGAPRTLFLSASVDF